ncbi:N-acetylmuramate alpha-1-phosphate uridylyltransferase MurU [Agarivorans gilvus]|uniref:Mannose-1-phosphate guanylyltransferase n=1 Tax=Agarivorans gilvus TaxID=680279 RepID=A0ABQ1I7B9_9ALTE|nr:nucleotidyltransferase family protein [Agarivorans gilvus]GGB19523.1 mannose-1-phosphate guanylyltransferase [Agarivorans gilvus]
MSCINTAMILAAGRGERMRPLTDHCPKPLLELAGKPLIEWHIDKLQAAGIRRIVVNTAYLGEQIEARLGNGRRWGLDILYSREVEALETAGGIVQALDLLDAEQFLVVNGDVWTDWDYRPLCQPSLEQRLAHLYLVSNPSHHPKGDFALQGQLVVDKPAFTFSGIAQYHQSFFAGLAPGRRALAPLLRAAMQQQQVSGQLHQGLWVDVGTPQRLQQLNQKLVKD